MNWVRPSQIWNGSDLARYEYGQTYARDEIGQTQGRYEFGQTYARYEFGQIWIVSTSTRYRGLRGRTDYLQFCLKWDYVLVNIDYELSFCRKSDNVQYQTLDGMPAPPLLPVSVKVILVLSQNRPCPFFKSISAIL